MYKSADLCENLVRYDSNDHYFYLAGDGQPINFINGKVMVGPIITLVQAEILLGIKQLIELKPCKGIFQIENRLKDYIAEYWLSHFFSAETGEMKHA